MVMGVCVAALGRSSARPVTSSNTGSGKSLLIAYRDVLEMIIAARCRRVCSTYYPFTPATRADQTSSDAHPIDTARMTLHGHDNDSQLTLVRD